MPEKIYTIPINEAFEHNDGCPMCRLFETLEKNELDLILGASMMEPDVRIATNRLGFCHEHLQKMHGAKKSLPLALLLQSHLQELNEALDKNYDSQAKFFESVNESCYVCQRINGYLENMYENLFWLFANDEAFKEKIKSQTQFCLPHYAELIKRAKTKLKKNDYKLFCSYINEIQKAHWAHLSKDIADYTAMFDYRNADAEWGDFKNAPKVITENLSGKKL